MMKKRYIASPPPPLNYPPIIWWVKTEGCTATIYYRTPENTVAIALLRYRFTEHSILGILPDGIDGSFMLVAALKEVARARDEKRHQVDKSLKELGTRKESSVVKCLSSPENRSLMQSVARLQCCIEIFKTTKSWYGARQLLETSKTQSLNDG